MTPFYLLLCFTSVYGRIALSDNILTDVTHELSNIHDDVKKTIETVTLDDNKNGVTDSNLGKPTPDAKLKKSCSDDIDNNIVGGSEPCEDSVGTALMLTPLLEQGRADEARNASSVNRSMFFGIESYSGFLTVNSTYKSHLFFWYFPSFAKPVNETPCMIWLQGGPGASSLTGLFDEIGPFRVTADGNLKFNPYTWLMNHSLVFIDNPVGTGYSFTEHEDGYVQDMATYGKHLYTAVRQLVQIFPELRVAPLYVAGESYAGKYVPALGYEIHRHKHAPGLDINLKGLIIGNAFVEPDMIKQLVRSLYNFGLLEKEQVEIVKPLTDAFLADIAANRSIEAKDKWMKLVTICLILSHQKHGYNFLTDDVAVGRFVSFLNKSKVKRAIHVGGIKFAFVNVTVNTKMAPDFLSTTKPIFEQMLDEYKVLAYCGQLDQMLPCAPSSEVFRKWKWSESDKFLASLRLPYFHNKKLAGYFKTGGNLTWLVVRGAGHMVPIDQPAVAQRLVAQWTHGQPLATIPTVYTSVITDFVETSLSDVSGDNNTMYYI